ncbi:hypothetical protein MKW94_019658 [Papaver nudicaule]|uniref:3'-5' exonuclease domain-containing protein n=1 Tax=Papaver nudicaule TaxID=74823 RepID=A0AA41UYT5_PAPNU|nr:hypothetical protein [Papaver nudicaule]
MTSSSSTDRSSVYYGRDNVSSIEVVDKSESTHHTYNVYYYEDKIYTTVTHTAFVVDKWIADVYSELHEKNLNNLGVGLDMEWTRVTENQVAVLQLCLSGRCLIFQISCCDKIPKSLDAFLSDERIIFFGAGKDMVPKLLEDHGLKVSRIAELGCLAAYRFTNNFVDFRESRFHAAGLTTLAKKILSQELPGQRYIEMSNWDKEFLSDEQIEYACLNAFVAFKIATYLFDESH